MSYLAEISSLATLLHKLLIFLEIFKMFENSFFPPLDNCAICQFFHIKVKAQFRASFKIWEQIEMKDNQYISKQYIEIKNIIFLPILQGDT